MSLEDKIASVEKKIGETEEKIKKVEDEGNEEKWKILMNDLKEQREYLKELQKEKNILLEQGKWRSKMILLNLVIA